jgi:pyrroloquinoline quinone (PQQ) biosynthesis protein C
MLLQTISTRQEQEKMFVKVKLTNATRAFWEYLSSIMGTYQLGLARENVEKM